MRQYDFEGRKLNADDYIAAMKTKYQYEGNFPRRWVAVQGGGDRGIARYEHAPTEEEYDQLIAAVVEVKKKQG